MASKDKNIVEDSLKNAFDYDSSVSLKTAKSEYERLVEENKKLKRKARCFDFLNETGRFVRFVTYKGERYCAQKFYIERNRVELTGKFGNSVVAALDEFLNEVMKSDCKKGELYDY